jgi:GxxExxY protein
MLRVKSPLSPAEEATVSKVIGCGIEVHRALGPGFRERTYETALKLELESRGLKFECEKAIDVTYKQWTIPGHRLDLVVEQTVVVELKTVPRIRPLHRRQLLSYLKASGLRVGLLMNFNTTTLKSGLERIVR